MHPYRESNYLKKKRALLKKLSKEREELEKDYLIAMKEYNQIRRDIPLVEMENKVLIEDYIDFFDCLIQEEQEEQEEQEYSEKEKLLRKQAEKNVYKALKKRKESMENYDEFDEAQKLLKKNTNKLKELEEDFEHLHVRARNMRAEKLSLNWDIGEIESKLKDEYSSDSPRKKHKPRR